MEISTEKRAAGRGVGKREAIGTRTAIGVCSRQYPVFPSSPLAFQASLQTSTDEES